MHFPTTSQLKAALIFSLFASAVFCRAQSPKDLVHAAFASRDVVKSAKLIVQSAHRNFDSQGAYPLTRLETAFGSQPDVNGGEDLTLFQPIDIFNKTRFGKAAGRAGMSQAEAGLRQTYIDVQNDVMMAFANWTNAIRLEQNANAQLDIAKTLQTVAAKKVELRAIPELQKVRADLEVDKQGQVVIDRKAGAEAAKVMLIQALGSDFATFDQRTVDGYDDQLIKQTQVELTRPDLLAIHADVLAARADSGLAKGGSLPDLELQLRRSPWSSGQEQYGARLQFVVPLWDHGASRGKAAASDLKAKASMAQYSDLLKRANAEVKAAEIQLAAATKSVMAYSKLVEYAKLFVEKSQRGFDLGASTIIDVLDARRALSDAMDSLAAAQLAKDLAITAGLKSRGQLLEEPK